MRAPSLYHDQNPGPISNPELYPHPRGYPHPQTVTLKSVTLALKNLPSEVKDWTPPTHAPLPLINSTKAVHRQLPILLGCLVVSVGQLMRLGCPVAIIWDPPPKGRGHAVLHRELQILPAMLSGLT